MGKLVFGMMQSLGCIRRVGLSARVSGMSVGRGGSAPLSG